MAEFTQGKPRVRAEVAHPRAQAAQLLRSAFLHAWEG